ncbi:MAG TPA: proline dehydrogenase family protein [Bacteroidales bacterium]|nr:proline dehydrogenase family protein [Bacteroidales bacterium]
MKNFDNTRLAFHDKTTSQLIRARWLFRLIANPFLVKIGSAFTRMAIKAGIPVEWALKPTVFSHFCGGETIEKCETVIQKLGESNIKTILDYSAEGKESDPDFDFTASQILATINKTKTSQNIPYAVFKPSGVARVSLLEKIQAGKILTEEENNEYERALARFRLIGQTAFQLGVPVMIDAEESWIQRIVDEITEEMMLSFNQEKPIVFATLQLYRTDRLEYLKSLFERLRQKGVYPGVKLVRGAYMEKERERAIQNGYPSPIYPDKPSTDKAFDEAVAFCLEHVDEMAVCIGTHNELSCALASEKIISMGIDRAHPNISFSQLLGMSDNISYLLAVDGFRVTKYVPFGPLKTVVPYLIRRAEENTSVAGQTSRELSLIETELRRRKAGKA